MAARIATLLLILSLLLCPFRCMGQQCGHQVASASPPKCHCCHHAPAQESLPADSNPARPVDDPSCCDNCLCHGVIQSGNDFQQVCHTLEFLADIPPVELSLLAVGQELPASRWDQSRHTDAPTGLAVRILHQSFLL